MSIPDCSIYEWQQSDEPTCANSCHYIKALLCLHHDVKRAFEITLVIL